jgi:hypothetical protein
VSARTGRGKLTDTLVDSGEDTEDVVDMVKKSVVNVILETQEGKVFTLDHNDGGDLVMTCKNSPPTDPPALR